MKIGLAQIKSDKGDINGNLRHHLDLLGNLAAGEVELVIFPELSLSNYDPDIAVSAAIGPEDTRLDAIQQFADRTEISVGVGFPERSSDKPFITLVVFSPSRPRTVIHKSHLHEDELPYFSTLNESASVLELSKRVAVAICYEITVDAHIESAMAKNMDLYLASVAKTAKGIREAKTQLSAKAREFKVPILVANSVGTCEGKVAGGGSMVIDVDGTVIGALNDTEEAILIYDSEARDKQKVEIMSRI